MRRPGQYADSRMDQMVSAKMQQMQAQRVQRNSGINHLPGRADTLQAEEEHHYMSKPEGQWQWDRDGPKGLNIMSPHMYREGQGNDAPRTSYHTQRPDHKRELEEQDTKDPKSQSHEEDMDVGYEDDIVPRTFEGLEQKFIRDLMKLTKEHQDAEDAENARHKDRLSEINNQHQDKLLAMRTRQATRREEFLRKESESRHQQYQQASVNQYQPSAGQSDVHSYGSNPNSSALGDPLRGYVDVSGYGGGPRGRGYEPHGQYPGGRAYNSGGRYF